MSSENYVKFNLFLQGVGNTDMPACELCVLLQNLIFDRIGKQYATGKSVARDDSKKWLKQ